LLSREDGTNSKVWEFINMLATNEVLKKEISSLNITKEEASE
jgi:hypothetical protein